MEKLYRKLKNGRYEEVGYSSLDLPNGLYFSQKTKSGKRTTSVNYWLGNVKKEPIDLQLLINIMSNDDSLALYLMRLKDDTKDYRELKDGNNYITEPLMFNWSPQDLALAVLNFIYKENS